VVETKLLWPHQDRTARSARSGWPPSSGSYVSGSCLSVQSTHYQEGYLSSRTQERAGRSSQSLSSDLMCSQVAFPGPWVSHFEFVEVAWMRERPPVELALQ
jgi:hypothetical protein